MFNFYTLTVKNIGQITIKSKQTLEELLKDVPSMHTSFSRFLKKHNTTVLQYINDNVQKLELCGFCNKNFSKYNYDLCVENGELKVVNVRLASDYSCKNAECIKERAKINPNSFEHIAKRKKISLEEADKWQKANNSSPFYLHPGESKEEYSKRQSRGIEYFKNKYGENYEEEWLKYCNKISNANKKEEVIRRHGKEYNDNLQNSKKQTLENFIKKYGEVEGLERHKHWISACTRVGIYLNDDVHIQSKQAYDFFIKLEAKLIEENVCTTDDILYADGNKRHEYKIIYFNENNKMRWTSLDFVILKYKIDVEFNGGRWHYNTDAEHNRSISSKTEEYENNRDDIIKKHDFKMIKIWDYEVQNAVTLNKKINEVVLNIKKIIDEVYNK